MPRKVETRNANKDRNLAAKSKEEEAAKAAEKRAKDKVRQAAYRERKKQVKAAAAAARPTAPPPPSSVEPNDGAAPFSPTAAQPTAAPTPSSVEPNDAAAPFSPNTAQPTAPPPSAVPNDGAAAVSPATAKREQTRLRVAALRERKRRQKAAASSAVQANPPPHAPSVAPSGEPVVARSLSAAKREKERLRRAATRANAVAKGAAAVSERQGAPAPAHPLRRRLAAECEDVVADECEPVVADEREDVAACESGDVVVLSAVAPRTPPPPPPPELSSEGSAALHFLKVHNPLFKDVDVSEPKIVEQVDGGGDVCFFDVAASGPQLPQAPPSGVSPDRQPKPSDWAATTPVASSPDEDEQRAQSVGGAWSSSAAGSSCLRPPPDSVSRSPGPSPRQPADEPPPLKRARRNLLSMIDEEVGVDGDASADEEDGALRATAADNAFIDDRQESGDLDPPDLYTRVKAEKASVARMGKANRRRKSARSSKRARPSGQEDQDDDPVDVFLSRSLRREKYKQHSTPQRRAQMRRYYEHLSTERRRRRRYTGAHCSTERRRRSARRSGERLTPKLDRKKEVYASDEMTRARCQIADKARYLAARVRRVRDAQVRRSVYQFERQSERVALEHQARVKNWHDLTSARIPKPLRRVLHHRMVQDRRLRQSVQADVRAELLQEVFGKEFTDEQRADFCRRTRCQNDIFARQFTAIMVELRNKGLGRTRGEFVKVAALVSAIDRKNDTIAEDQAQLQKAYGGKQRKHCRTQEAYGTDVSQYDYYEDPFAAAAAAAAATLPVPAGTQLWRADSLSSLDACEKGAAATGLRRVASASASLFAYMPRTELVVCIDEFVDAVYGRSARRRCSPSPPPSPVPVPSVALGAEALAQPVDDDCDDVADCDGERADGDERADDADGDDGEREPALYRMCNRECDELMEQCGLSDWAVRLHEALRRMTLARTDSVVHFRRAISDFEYCAGCDENPKECALATCTDHIRLMRAVQPHFPGIRSLLRRIYRMRQCHLYAWGVDVAFESNNVSQLMYLHDLRQGQDLPHDVVQRVLAAQSDEADQLEAAVFDTYKKQIDAFQKAVYASMRAHPCDFCEQRVQWSDLTTVAKLLKSLRPLVPEDDREMAVVDTGAPATRELLAYWHLRGFELDRRALCKTCYNSLRLGKIPKLSVLNALDVQPTPPELANLNNFERPLLQLAKMFHTVLQLGTYGKSDPSTRISAMKLNSVTIEHPLEATYEYLATQLPRLDSVSIIVDSLKTHAKKIWRSLVDMDKVTAALRWLKANNPLFASIDISPLVPDDASAADAVVVPCAERAADAASDVPSSESAPSSSTADDSPPIGADNPPIDCQPSADPVDPEVLFKRVQGGDYDTTGFTLHSMAHSLPNVDDYQLYVTRRLYTQALWFNREPRIDLMCYPELYPDARGGQSGPLDGEARCGKRKYGDVSAAEFEKHRIRHVDPRFRRNQAYMFFMGQNKVARDVQHAIFTVTNTTKFRNVGELRKYIQNADATKLNASIYTLMSNIPGTSQYWSARAGDLDAMDETLGPATWFLTLSCAEFSWKDMGDFLRLMNADVPGVDTMPQAKLCKKDPSAVAEHFYLRWLAFRTKVINDRNGPLGEVEHYVSRIEYQARGAPHLHLKLWVKGAPLLKSGEERRDRKNEQEVAEFIDRYITCWQPSRLNNPTLSRLVEKFQMHSCERNGMCLRRRRVNGDWHTKCRFNFPRPSCPLTRVHPMAKVAEARRNGGTAARVYTLKRSVGSEKVNDYNAAVLMIWQANMDLQFCGETSMILNRYITSYISKGEKIASAAMWESIDKTKSRYSILRTLANQHQGSREVGEYENAMRLHGFPLSTTSTVVRYLNCRPPDQRLGRLKTVGELATLDDDSDQFTYKNWYSHHYPYRHRSLANECLYDVMANYEFKWSKPAPKRLRAVGELVVDEQDVAAAEVLDDGFSADAPPPRAAGDGVAADAPLPPAGGDVEAPPPESVGGAGVPPPQSADAAPPTESVSGAGVPPPPSADAPPPPAHWLESIDEQGGFLIPRTKPAVIRAPKVKRETEQEREDYFYGLLFMFRPWRVESDLTFHFATREAAFQKLLVEWAGAPASFHRFCKARAVMDEAKRQIAQIEAVAEDAQGWEEPHATDWPGVPVVDGIPGVDDTAARGAQAAAAGAAAFVPASDEELCESEARLKPGQRDVFDTVVNSVVRDEHLRLIVSGVAGTGKSRLINTLCARLRSHFSNQNAVVVVAPTGIAAYNVGGVTAHRLWKLPVQHGKRLGEQPFSTTELQKFRKAYQNTKLFIVDEMSMVSNELLMAVNRRMHQAFPEAKGHFGGRSFILVGDLLQLPPVLLPPVFVPGKTGFNMTLDLWTPFDYRELTENVRQCDDRAWSELLDRVRLGSPTMADIDLLLERRLTRFNRLAGVESEDFSSSDWLEIANCYRELRKTAGDCICLLPLNPQVAKFNEAMLALEDIPTVVLSATDTDGLNRQRPRRAPKQTAPQSKAAVAKKASDTAGLELTLRLGIGARVMLRRNLDVTRGLVNGALGTVKELKYSPQGEVVCVVVQFDSMAEPYAVARVSVGFEVSNSLYVTRRQFPLTLAWAMTIHKCQGLTLNNVLLDLGEAAFGDAMVYVALSRVRSLAGVHFIRFAPGKIRCSTLAYAEYARLRATRDMDPLPPANVLPEGVLAATDEFAGQRRGQRPAKRAYRRDAVPAARTEDAAPTNSVVAAAAVAQHRYLRLDNAGNTCFADSVAQLLVRLDRLCNLLWTTTESAFGLLRREIGVLRQAHVHAQPGGSDAHSTEGLLRVVRAGFNDGQQHDVHAFFDALLAQMPVAVRRLFEFEEKYTRECQDCWRRSSSEVTKTHHILLAPANLRGSFADAISGDNAPFVEMQCTDCGGERNHQHKVIVERNFYDDNVPGAKNKYVVVMVKLFSRAATRRAIELTGFKAATGYRFGRPMCKLVGALCHSGASIDSGHYTAIVRDAADAKWLELDNGHCRERKFVRNLEGVYFMLFERP